MATLWTPPHTYAPTEVPTAALLNDDIRDNLNETGPAKITAAGQRLIGVGPNELAAYDSFKLKTVDDSWSNFDTTFRDVLGLGFNVGSGQKWLARYLLVFTGAGSNGQQGNLDITWTYPSLAANRFWAEYGGGGSVPQVLFKTGQIPASGVRPASGSNNTTYALNATNDTVVVTLYIQTAAAGVVQIQASQVSTIPDANTHTIAAGSLLSLDRLS